MGRKIDKFFFKRFAIIINYISYISYIYLGKN